MTPHTATPAVPEPGRLPDLVQRTPEAHQVGQAVAMLRSLAVELDALADRHPTEWEGLTYLRGVLRVLISDLRTVERKVEDLQAAAMPGYQADVEGVGRIKRHSGKGWARDRWAHDRLVARLGRHAVVTADGEVEQLDPVAAAIRGAAAVLECARVEWKLGALRDRGIDPEDYGERTEGRRTVQMPRMDG